MKTLSRLEIKTVRCNNVTGSSYIETPQTIKALPFERCQQERQFLLLVLYSGSPVLSYWQAFPSQQPQEKHRKLVFEPEAHANAFIRYSLVRKT